MSMSDEEQEKFDQAVIEYRPEWINNLKSDDGRISLPLDLENPAEPDFNYYDT